MVPIVTWLRPLALLCALVLALAACGEGEQGSPPSSQPEATPAPGTEDADSPPDGSSSRDAPPEEAEEGVDEEPDAPDDEVAGDDPEPATAHPEPIEPPAPYVPVEGEVRPNAKRLAARIAEGLTTYEVEDEPAEVVAEVAGGALAEQFLDDAAPLLHEDAWSRGRVVYPQLGGMLQDATSVMVVIEQTVGLPDGTLVEQTRTLDVRLALEDGNWILDGLASAGGEPVPRPDDLPDEAVAVLEDERIDLPDSAVWDIHRGIVHEDLLTLMTRMADRIPYGVVVLDTGHPWEIFGTDRQSKHTMGQAVDIHWIGDEDGRLVIQDRQEGSATHELVRWIYDQPELSEVGSPWALDGFGGRSFTDQLHQDHLHIGVADRS